MRRLAVLLTLFSLSLSLGACGGSSDEKKSTEPASTQPAVTAQAPVSLAAFWTVNLSGLLG